MRIGVILPCYNAAPFLEQAVASILETRQPDLHLYLIDDGSTDATLAIARAVTARVPNAVVLRHAGGQNRGVSESRNLGLRRAIRHCDLIAFHDADDVMLPHRFHTPLEMFSNDPNLDGVYELGEVIFAGNASDRQTWADNTDGLIGIRTELAPADLIRRLVSSDPWLPGGFTARPRLFERAGLFAPHLRIAEDIHLWIRMVCSGILRAGDLKRPVFLYRRHGANSFSVKAETYYLNIRATAELDSWMHRHRVAPLLRLAYRTAFRDYLNQVCYNLHQLGRNDLLLRTVAATIHRAGPWALWDYRVGRQVVEGLWGLFKQHWRFRHGTA